MKNPRLPPDLNFEVEGLRFTDEVFLDLQFKFNELCALLRSIHRFNDEMHVPEEKSQNQLINDLWYLVEISIGLADQIDGKVEQLEACLAEIGQEPERIDAKLDREEILREHPDLQLETMGGREAN